MDYNNQQQNQAAASGNTDLGQMQFMTNDEREELAMKRYNAMVDDWKKEQQLRRKMRLVSAIVTSVLLASAQGVFDEPIENKGPNNQQQNAQNNTNDEYYTED